LGHLKTLRRHALRVGVGKTASGDFVIAINGSVWIAVDAGSITGESD
jgi:hypothetical protein